MALFRDKSSGKPSIRDLTREAQQSTDPFQAGAIFTQAAELALELNKKRKAISLARDAMAALGHAHGDSRTVAGAHARVAHLAEKLGLSEEAMRCYRQAFTLDPSLVSAAQAARNIAMATSSWSLAVQILEQEIAAVGTRHERAELMREKAALVRDRIGDLDFAIDTLHRAIDMDVASISARKELVTSLLARANSRKDQDWAARDRDEAATLLCDTSDLVPDEERLELLEAALDVAPEHLGALEKLEDVIPTDVPRLVYHWTRHVDAFPESPVGDELRLRLGRAHLEAGRSEAALPHLETLARQNDVECAVLVVELHARAGRVDEARAWASALRDRLGAEERLPILRRLFQAFRDADVDAAYDIARAILRDDPTDAVALDCCETHCTQAGRWEELEQLLAGLAEQFEAGSKRRLHVLRKLAHLREKNRSQPALALETWHIIEDETEDDSWRHARDERIRLAESVAEWDELAELLEDAANRARLDKRIELLTRLAKIHRDRRDDPASAARAFLRILDSRAEHDRDDTLASLAAVLKSAGPESDAMKAARELAERSEPALRIEIFRVLARLFDGFAAHEPAFEAWTKLREDAADDTEAIVRLVELAVATERWEHAVELLELRVQKSEGRPAVELYRRIATIASDSMSDFDRAADALTSALEAVPEDRLVAEELSVALGRAERHGEQAVVLRRLAASAPDPTTRRQWKIRLARHLEGPLRDRDEALAVWGQIASDTDDVDVLEGLIAAARGEQDHERTEILLRRLAVVAPETDRRAELAVELAEVLAEKLERSRDAVMVLVDAMSREAKEHLPALSYLESLAATLGDDYVVASALEAQLPLVPETARKLLLKRLADLYEGPLEDPRAAVHTLERWEQARADDPEPRVRLIPHLVAMRSWEPLLARLDTLIAIAPQAHAEHLDNVVREVDRADPSHDHELAVFFLELAKRAASPEQRRDMLLRAAALFELSNAPTSAFDAAAGALAITGPEDRMLAIVDRLAGPAGRTLELDAIYDRFTAKNAPPEMRRTLALRHAEILFGAERWDDATDRLLRVSALAPSDDSLLDALERGAARANRISEVLSAYEDRVALVEPGGAAVHLMLRAVQASYANERGYDAVRFFARAVQLSDGDLVHMDRIEAAAEPLGRSAVEQMMTVYEAAARNETVPDRRGALLVRCARLMLKAAPEAVTAAARLFDEALEAAPTEEWLLDTIESNAVELGFLDRLDAHLEKLIEETMSDEVAATLLRRRARILHNHLGKPSEAADTYLRLWALRPKDRDVFRQLRVCLLETGRVHELISAAERELSKLDDPDDSIALMREIARLWEEEAKNQWEAADAWKRVLATAPEDEKAKEAIARLAAPRGKGA